MHPIAKSQSMVLRKCLKCIKNAFRQTILFGWNAQETTRIDSFGESVCVAPFLMQGTLRIVAIRRLVCLSRKITLFVEKWDFGPQ